MMATPSSSASSATSRDLSKVTASWSSAAPYGSDSLSYANTVIRGLRHPYLEPRSHELPNDTMLPSDTLIRQHGFDESDKLPDLSVRTTDYLPVSSFRALQEWEGYVIEIGTDHFVARLLDITADSFFEEEEATIPLAEISERDKERLELGSIFRWVIGYEWSATGTKRRVSEIVFRDLPALSDADLREGQDWAKQVTRLLNL